MKTALYGILMFCGWSVLVGAVPLEIGHQGRLVDNRGVPLQGEHEITFSLFDHPLKGDALYMQTQVLLLVDGLYTFALGEGDTHSSLLQNALAAQEVYLEIDVDGAILAPREKLRSSPYAIWSRRVEAGGVGNEALAGDAVTSDKIQDGTIQPRDLDTAKEDAYTRTFARMQSAMTFRPPAPDLMSLMLEEVGDGNRLNLLLQGVLYRQVLGFHVEESLSESPRMVVEFLSPNPGLVVALGALGSVQWQLPSDTRSFNGVVTRCSRSGRVGGQIAYLAVLEPVLQALHRSGGYRIFQQMTAIDVVQSILSDRGLPGMDSSRVSEVQERDMFVQYRETDLNFIQRLLEEEGIWYAVDATDPEASMFMGDENGDMDDLGTLNYFGPFAEPPSPGAVTILTLPQSARAQHPQSIQFSEYIQNLGVTDVASVALAQGEGERMFFDAPLANHAERVDRAGIQLNAWAADARIFSGYSTAARLRPGGRVTIRDQVDGGSSDFLIAGVHHSGLQVRGDTNRYYFVNTYRALPIPGVEYRPPRRTPQPRVSGMTSATVTGAAGERSYVDQFGRIKVRFHWDRYGTSDEHASGWIPLMHQLHGSNHSLFFLPEVGDEVLVSFLEGDPDRPVVVGALASAGKPPPFALPEERYKSLVRTEGPGGAPTRNEILFDDTPGREGTFLSARILDGEAFEDLTLQSGMDMVLAAGNDFELTAGGSNLDLTTGGVLGLHAPSVQVTGALESRTALGSGTHTKGRYYQDNATLAWARIAATGKVEMSFGIQAVVRVATGHYQVTIDASTEGLSTIAMVTPEIDSLPTVPAHLVIASVNQTSAGSQFEVFLNHPDGTAVSNDFMFVVVGR